jgi:hypothetical protein
MILDWTTLERLAGQDRQDRLREWERWASEPVPMYLVIRLMAAVYARRTLPSEIETHVEAEAWACDIARQARCRVCLATGTEPPLTAHWGQGVLVIDAQDRLAWFSKRVRPDQVGKVDLVLYKDAGDGW